MKQVKIFFDEAEHKYTDDEGNVYTSATQVLGKVSVPYDSQYWAVYRVLDMHRVKMIPNPERRVIKIKQPKTDNPFNDTYKDYHIDDLIIKGEIRKYIPKTASYQQVLDEWTMLAEVACDWGNERHNYLEDCINSWYGETTTVAGYREGNLQLRELPNYKLKIMNYDELYNSPLRKTHKPVFNLLATFLNDGYTIYAEKRVYSYKHKISGTIDVLCVKGNDFYIVDWKTNKDEMKFESGYYKKAWNEDRTLKEKTNEWISNDETFLYPLDKLPYCKGYVYSLQLSLYAYICELWGLKCKGLVIVHIRHDETIDPITRKVTKKEKAPKIYMDIQYLRDEIHTLFNWFIQSDEERNQDMIPNGITQQF